ncbi:MAG: urease accessory protein UreE [Pseudomonadota bacterium]
MWNLQEIYEGAGESAAVLALPFEKRQRSRLRATLTNGEEAIVVLPRGGVLRGGDRLRADDGRIVEIKASLEQLSAVYCDDPLLLTRAAYHLGNRHVAVQIDVGRLCYLHDHVLDAMVEDLGLSVRVEIAAFEPESGAYGKHGGHVHHGD